MRRTKDGLWYRPSDKPIIDEVQGCYGPIPVQSDDVLLDLGAHIGATTALVMAKGAKSAVAVEADPENVLMLRRNLGRRQDVRIIGAAVGATLGMVPFYVDPDRRYLGTSVPVEGRKRVLVPMLPFAALLAQHKPTIVKVDIEFGEWSLLPELQALPEQVRVLAIEIHVRHTIIRGHLQLPSALTAKRREALDLVAAIEAQGFREVRRKDKQARPGEPRAEDDVPLHPMLKAIDAVYVR